METNPYESLVPRAMLNTNPAPNETGYVRRKGGPFEPVTVVATCPYIDDPDRERETLVLLLRRKAPFFVVGHYRHKSRTMLVLGVVQNIVEAVQIYEDNGGDI